MIIRFCLYGFLKNQRYFAPFWILAFLDKGLSFAMIGALLGFREICVSFMEVPTGGIADSIGRRWAMIASHAAYIVAFVTLAFSTSLGLLFLGMFVFSIGEAFRTGTHKAMIFAWLKSLGREDEKTEVYGLTRSWSKMGSAVSALVAAALVFLLEEYSVIFWLSAIPAALNIINFAGYPRELDGRRCSGLPKLGKLIADLWGDTLTCISNPLLRRPIVESIGFEGMYSASKDYLQPVIQQMVLALPLMLMWESTQRTAVMIALVYTTLHLISSLASRRAGKIAHWLGGSQRASPKLWIGFGATFGALFVGTVTSWSWLAVVSFVVLAVLQNVWRPILVSRVADFADEEAMATILSVESQAKSLGAAMIAPLLGFLVDSTPAPYQFGAVAIVGLCVTAIALSLSKGEF